MNCRFCGEPTVLANTSYLECEQCDVMISLVPEARYDENYYYAVRNARSRASIKRASLLAALSLGDLLGTRCLDFGCNDGAFAAMLTARGRQCIGVDINESVLDFARDFGDAELRCPED